MATKLKNIKYAYGLKTVAFLLAAACVFSGAWSAGSIVNILNDFGWENTMVREKPVFTDTALFQNEVDSASQNLCSAYIYNDWETDALPNYATLAEEQAAAEQVRRQLRESVYNELSGEYSYLYNEYGEPVTAVSGSETQTYTPTEEELEEAYSTASSFYSLRDFDVDVYINASMTAEELAADVAELYTAQLNYAQRSFRAGVLRAEEAISSLRNFRYLLVNTQTGEVLTNMAGVSTAADFFNAFSDDDWYFGYTVESGLIRYSESAAQMAQDSTQSSGMNSFLMPFLDSNFSEEGFDVYFGVSQQLSEGDSFWTAAQTFETSSAQIDRLMAVLVCTLTAALALSVYLLLTAGRVRGSDEIQFLPQDRLPCDIHLFLSGVICLGLTILALWLMDGFIGTSDTSYQIRSVSLLQLGASFCAALLYAFLAEWVLSVTKYAKSRRPYFGSMLLVRGARRFAAWVRRTRHRMTHISKKAIVLACVYLLVNFLLFATGNSVMLLPAIVFNVIALVLIWKYLSSLDKIMDAAEAGKRGEKTAPLNADRMPEPLGSLARNLTVTQEEMQKAVQEAVKGERMKAELITNVSHDLKTPLTSIISYVDLLKKCDIDDPNAQNYITVLDEKSTRLKRLIEDLVEASKASSGAVTLHKMHVNLYELAVQAIGEMEDSFAERDLQIVLNTPEEAPVVFADSQKTWRVIDNLLSNARKYSLPGSRVYVDVFPDGSNGVFRIKNVSGEPLNIDPDELTQRFVRGDASRTLEGSGLGLSIAKDLCALQGGKLKLEIDGDLFKATVSLPASGAARLAEAVQAQQAQMPPTPAQENPSAADTSPTTADAPSAERQV